MVYRIYVEKKADFAQEAESLRRELTDFLGVKGLEKLRLLNRYDAEAISPEQFEAAIPTVFSEPQVDTVCREPELAGAGAVFAVEYLPGQFDQRADSAAQCVQILFQSERPLIRSAKVYALYGSLSAEDVEQVKKYVINPVEAREAALELPATLKTEYEIPSTVRTLEGFRALDEAGLAAMVRDYGLAMDEADIAFCQAYFRREDRDPTITELRMIDTYWSDHCRHTTFHTILDGASFEDPTLQKTWEEYLALRRDLGRTKPPCLMDLATIAVRQLRREGKLDKLDESE
ncbi:MAG: phosphoribosylformylglycinamidine synthase, partial [Oscillospiraceae bacterium]|nr:phosphoribosylformylglycinamidine synthase [Oscillospiraceae bacterium]